MNDNGPMSAVEERINERIGKLNELKASLMQQAREYDKEISTLRAVLNPQPESSIKSKPGPKAKADLPKPVMSKDEMAAPGANAQ